VLSTCPRTGFVTDAQRREGREILTGRWSIGIDTALHRNPDLAPQGDTPRRGRIRAAHAHERSSHGHREPHRDAATGIATQFTMMKIDPERRAAGTA
jgi:hypothetical protein